MIVLYLRAWNVKHCSWYSVRIIYSHPVCRIKYAFDCRCLMRDERHRWSAHQLLDHSFLKPTLQVLPSAAHNSKQRLQNGITVFCKLVKHFLRLYSIVSIISYITIQSKRNHDIEGNTVGKYSKTSTIHIFLWSVSPVVKMCWVKTKEYIFSSWYPLSSRITACSVCCAAQLSFIFAATTYHKKVL